MEQVSLAACFSVKEQATIFDMYLVYAFIVTGVKSVQSRFGPPKLGCLYYY
jgi:hypothetical protein